MAVMPIITYGNPLLRQKAEEVQTVDEEIRHLVRSMEETLAGENGIGLAAPQVGISKRILIVDLTKSRGDRKIALLNPKIVFRSPDYSDYEEGCLSVPGVWGNVSRPRRIKIKGTLLAGQTMILDADELFARVLQHELDHLEGKLFIDYLSPEEREENRDKIEAILETNRKKLGHVAL